MAFQQQIMHSLSNNSNKLMVVLSYNKAIRLLCVAFMALAK